MPNTLSAKKRVRQNAKRRAINTWRKRRIKTQVKTFLQAVHDQDVKTAEAEFRKTCGLLDRCAGIWRLLHAASRFPARIV